jgi:hypothetical protein
MFWPLKIVVLAVLSLLPAGTHPVGHRMPAVTKRHAERNVLGVVARSWPRQAGRAGLMSATSGQLQNNVQAICAGRGTRIGTRYHRYRCVVRAWPPGRRAKLVVAYRARRDNRFRIHLLSRR